MKRGIGIILGLAVVYFGMLFIFSDHNPRVIKTSSYEGAIITDRIDSTWTPDKKVIDEFERGLEEYLNDIAPQHGRENRISLVIKNLKNYKRQYVGITIDGEKVLHCNFLITEFGDEKYLEYDNWYKQYIVTLDGGWWYFTINYEVEKKRFFNLRINGSA